MTRQLKQYLKRQRLGFTAELILRQKNGYIGLALNILESKINEIDRLLK